MCPTTEEKFGWFGGKSLIAHSKDGGFTWKKQNVLSARTTAGKEPQSPQAPLPQKGASLESFDFASKAYAAEKAPRPSPEKGER